MKNIPNSVSVSRMILSVVLLFLPLPSAVFYVIYIIAGLSDLLDGFLARKLRCVSRIGTRLDIIADLTLYGMLLIKLFTVMEWQPWMMIAGGITALLKAACIITGAIKHKRLFYTHTYANKAAGFSVFLWPIIAAMFGNLTAAVIIAVVTAISAVEEIIIILIMKEYNNRRRCLFPLNRL